MTRSILNDGFNSLIHFSLGLAAAYFTNYTRFIVGGFITYQVSEFAAKNDNIFVDVSEFILGYMTIKFF